MSQGLSNNSNQYWLKSFSYKFLSFILLISSHSCIQIKQSVVDENEFLGHKVNDTGIYVQGGFNKILNPFTINTDNWGVGTIKRLLLVEFEPLNNYDCIELQVVENRTEKGALVILYYADSKQADVYHSPNLIIDPTAYKMILNEATVQAATIEYSFLEENGLLKADLRMYDRFGHQIHMIIDEKIGGMLPCELLAPIGGEAEHPEFMTLVYMKHFRFLSQMEEFIDVTIDQVHARLKKLPVKINGVKGYQTKYSMEPVTMSWNKAASSVLVPISVIRGGYKDSVVEIETIINGSHHEISAFKGIQNDHRMSFRFSPAIPDLMFLNNCIEIAGRFTIGVDDTQGIIAGEYEISNYDDTINIEIKPTKGYSPVPGKAWMKKLVWSAKISSSDITYFIDSKWIKK